MIDIAHATPADEADWTRLWSAYVRFYKSHVPDGVTRATWRRILDEDHVFRCYIARDSEQEGRAVGFALHWPHPSSWCAVGDMYLEDLYVDADARGQGVGRALIEKIIDAAKAEKYDRVYWMTEVTNTTARTLYDKLARDDNHIRYRIEF